MGLIADDVVVDNVIYKVLVCLIPAIEWIDGQCGPCIRNFISDANEELERLGIRYRYSYNDEQKVEVIKV